MATFEEFKRFALEHSGPIEQGPQQSRQQRRAQERQEAVNKAINKLQRLQALQARRLERNQMQPTGYTREQQ
jgi:hypothetical protein